MTEILLGPTMTDGPTTKVKDKASGKIYYKKRILPEGTFKYKTSDGKDVDLDLTANQLKTFVKSFKDGAYDEVPFQFGKHDNDPARRKGTVALIEHVPGKGVDGYFELEKEAAAYVEKYPNFGVSPRIVLGIDRADGKKFTGAIQHVAGTVVPRMTGMGPWEKVELSEDDNVDTDAETPVIDLSTETIEVKREVTIVAPEQKTGETTYTLSQEDYEFFNKMKAEYAKAEAILGNEGDGEVAATPPAATVDLSEVTSKANQALAEIAQMRAAATAETWQARKALLLSQGVPPAALDLADPVMTSVDSQVYDLSDGEGGTVKVDAKTQMLGQLELMKGMIDLGSEIGHGQGGAGVAGITDTPEDYDKWLRANGL